MNSGYQIIINPARERQMEKQKARPRKLRQDLTTEQRERAERTGRLPAGQKLKTAWSMRVEKFIPSREQH
jgi:hypothetical protein